MALAVIIEVVVKIFVKESDYGIRGENMRKMIMAIISVAAIAGIAITAVCMPEDRF